jgi:transcriptional regulator with XRE-family HTH domain
LAEALRVSQGTVSQWEGNVRKPSDEHIKQLKRKLGNALKIGGPKKGPRGKGVPPSTKTKVQSKTAKTRADKRKGRRSTSSQMIATASAKTVDRGGRMANNHRTASKKENNGAKLGFENELWRAGDAAALAFHGE